MVLSRCLGSLALFLTGAEGARISRKHSYAPNTKFIGGVPVLNYHLAYDGEASLSELEQLDEREQEWVVVVKPGTSDAQIQRMCKQNKNGCKLAGHPTGGVPFIEMRGTEQDLENVVHSSNGAAQYVEPDTEVHMIPEIEADDVEAATWGLNRIGADQRGRAGAGATIFVLDTGVRVSHQEFSGRAVPALDMTVGNPLECNGDMSCAGDRQGHGTHCAGTAAGESFGVAPSAAVQSVKVLSDRGSGSWSWSYYALDWMATNPTRPAVASMSLGGFGTQQAMRDAVDAAVNAGVVVVVAGGNSNSDACRFSPAFVPSAITVGSTTSLDARSSFSNYGSCTNIWAPGSSVVSASHTSDGGSRSLSGTSMACPHVSGAAALVLEADPSMKSTAVLQELLASSERDVLSGLRTGDTNALLYVGERAADVITNAVIPLGVSDCGGSNHLARIVDYNPKSVNTGVTTTINATAVLSSAVSGGTLNAKVSMSGFPWTTLGEIRNGNICNPITVELRSLGIYGGKLEWSGINCPIAAGTTTIGLKLTLASGLPANLLGTKGELTGRSADGKPLLCATTTTRR